MSGPTWVFDSALFTRVERAFRSFFVQNSSGGYNNNAAPPASLSSWIRDLSIPIAVNTSTVAGQRFWLDKVDGLARDRCRKAALELLNEFEMMMSMPTSDEQQNDSSSSSEKERITYLLTCTSQFHKRFLRATKFLSAACYHVEQAAVETAQSLHIYFDPAAQINVTAKAQRKAVEAAKLEHIFAQAFLVEFVQRMWKNMQQQQQSSLCFLAQIADAIVDMNLSSSPPSSSSAPSAAAATAIHCAGVFSSISGFRTEHLLPALRRRVVIVSAAVSDKKWPPESSSSVDRARAVFDLMRLVHSAASQLLPAKSGVREFKLQPNNNNNNNTTITAPSKETLKFARRDYSRDHSAIQLVQFARVHALGGEVKMADEINSMLLDVSTNDDDDVEEESLTRAIAFSKSSNNNIMSNDAFVLFSVAGVESTAKALAAQAEDYLLETMEDLLTHNRFREMGLASHGGAIYAMCLPWMRFVTCDECLAVSPFRPLPACVAGKCCAGHTIVASALRGAIHSAFSFPKFSAFVTANLLLYFHERMMVKPGPDDRNALVEPERTRLLQLIANLSTSSTVSQQQQPQSSSSSSSTTRGVAAAAATSSSDKDPADAALAHAMLLLGQSATDWTWAFHQLAFDRLQRRVELAGDDAATREETRRIVELELQCAEMLRHVVATDAAAYVRKYRGLVKACDASLKLTERVSAAGNEDDDHSRAGAFVIPFHFAAFLSTESIPVMSVSCSGVQWPLSYQKQVQDFVAATTPSTRLHWMPDDGTCRAEVKIGADVVAVCGSPLQIAILFFVGRKRRAQIQRGNIDGELFEFVFGEKFSTENSSSSASRNSVSLRCALAALSSALLISPYQETCSGAVELNDSFLLAAAAEQRSRDGEEVAVVEAIDVRQHSAFSRSRSENLRSVYTSAVQTALSKNWGPITAADKREFANQQQQRQQMRHDEQIRQQTSCDGSDSGGSSGTNTPRGEGAAAAAAAAVRRLSRISTVAAKALAIHVLKREGKLAVPEWLRRTREVLARSTVTQELPSRQFREAVVPELVQAEFVQLEDDSEGKQVAVYLP